MAGLCTLCTPPREGGLATEAAELDFTRVRNAIAFHREKARINQTQLARRAKVARWRLNRFENGVQLPTEAVLLRIAKALRVTAEDLYSEAALALIRGAEKVA